MTVGWIDKTEIVRRINDITCNLCGKSCCRLGNFEALHFQENWGYGSPWDCQLWDGHLCPECAGLFKEWLESKGGHIDIKQLTVDGQVIDETNL